MQTWAGTKVAVLTAGERTMGGADRLIDGLANGLCALGAKVEIIRVPGREDNFEQIIENYERTRELELSEFDAVISTKAPSYVVQHPRHVAYLVHTIRVFDDMFDTHFESKTPELFEQRKTIHDLDFDGLSNAQKIFCIGQEVKGRLFRNLGLDSEVIHPPLSTQGYVNLTDDGSFFMPGRLHPWKRVDLAIRAVKDSDLSVRLNIAGTGESEDELKALAGGDRRIQFLGSISDEDMLHHYGSCRAVLFVPIREDYGYITIEAFASGKPVITCVDSGEPQRIVQNGYSGFVVEPTPDAMLEAIRALSTDAEKAQRFGHTGAESVVDLTSWDRTCMRLLEAAFADDSSLVPKTTSVTVLDMQPIEPPVGGGRLRLLGLYHDLGERMNTTYVGTYDWPGERPRRLELTPRLTEITVPLSDAHYERAAHLAALAGGKTVIDIAFSKLGKLSPDYVGQAIEAIKSAEVVIFSHPWVFPLVREVLHRDQLLVYDSQNVEVYLRRQILDPSQPQQRQLLEGVACEEYAIIRAADLVLACSHDDAQRFNRVYDLDFEKIRVVPNGVMALTRRPPDKEDKRKAREALGLGSTLTAIFLGSPYEPNVEAARFIADDLAPAMPDVCFVIAGGVGEAIKVSEENVRVTGRLDGKELDRWLIASNLAINPMFSGSGTNIKMFDFMAVGLPVVTTLTGARGIDTVAGDAFIVVEGSIRSFVDAIEAMRLPQKRAEIGSTARSLVEQCYSWEVISRNLGKVLSNFLVSHTQRRPLFSVVVPSYDRHDQLDRLLRRLAEQVEVDFEVIVVDQSRVPYTGATTQYGFEFNYIHSEVRGAVFARNLGAFVAKGSILAFVDDDCVPDTRWLLNARRYFVDKDVVGVEGMIYSDRLDDPSWRPVTNVDFGGIGFMSANLFVRQDAFQRVGGFDIRFENPHFREDTDLGWRLLDLGLLPYAEDVAVFHPAQPRSKERESAAERVKFFQKDALLYRKHPQRYYKLFMAERHFQHTRGFRENLLAGFEANGVVVPSWMFDMLNRYKDFEGDGL